MVTVRVKSGTPKTGASLCTTCHWGLVRKGSRLREEEVFCNSQRPSARVHFNVYECSAYSDRGAPSIYSMEKIAWVLLTKSAGRGIGFVSAEKFREIEGEDAEITPAASHLQK